MHQLFPISKLCEIYLPCHEGDDVTDDVVAQVHLQTQQEVKMRMVGMAMHVVKNDGVLALYNGLSASLCRQVRDTTENQKKNLESKQCLFIL